MKTTKLKALIFFVSLLFLSACNQTNSQNKKGKPLSHSKKTVVASGIFTGKYMASYANASISAELTENNTVVKGFFYMDGVKNEIFAISNKNTFIGKLVDKGKNVHYDVTALLKDNVLRFSITFPELNNQVVELLLTKQVYTSGGENSATITN